MLAALPTSGRKPTVAGESPSVTDLFAEPAMVAERRGIVVALWTRRSVIALFTAIPILGLLNVFGQRTSASTAQAPAATLRVTAPSAVRGGLFFQSRVEIRARRALQHPRLVLDEGWTEGMQVNSVEPNPIGETGRDGRVVLSYDALDAGERLVVWLQFEVNPTNLGHRSYGLELDDAETEVAAVHRHLTVFP
jgi:hypothetical protein